jgi:hypothetical protein
MWLGGARGCVHLRGSAFEELVDQSAAEAAVAAGDQGYCPPLIGVPLSKSVLDMVGSLRSGLVGHRRPPRACSSVDALFGEW